MHPVPDKALWLPPYFAHLSKQHAWFLSFLILRNQSIGKSCTSWSQPPPTSSTVNHFSLNHFHSHLDRYNSLLISLFLFLEPYQKTLHPAATVILPKCNSDHITLPPLNSAVLSPPVRPKLMWSGSQLPSASHRPALCLVYSVPVSLPCCSTNRARLPQGHVLPLPPDQNTTLQSLPTHSPVLFWSLPIVTSPPQTSERFPLTQSGTPLPWPVSILSPLTLLDFSSQHFHYWHYVFLNSFLVSSSTSGGLGLDHPLFYHTWASAWQIPLN